MSFGNRLRNLRLENNMTQEDLSKKLNVSRATVGRYETNERFPDKNTLNNIADVFKVSIDYLFERTNCRNENIYLKEVCNTGYMKSNIYRKMEHEIMKRLLEENLISTERYIPEDMLEDIIQYGIDAAIKIAKLKKDRD